MQYMNPKRLFLFTKQNGKCASCDTLCTLDPAYIKHATFFTVDHIVPKSRGGLRTWSNVQGLCIKCNTKKANNMVPPSMVPPSIVPVVPDPLDDIDTDLYPNRPRLILANVKKITPYTYTEQNMSYKIVITKVEPNEEYEEQLKRFNESNRPYGMDRFMEPVKNKEVVKLETVLTDAEFDIVRKACIGQVN